MASIAGCTALVTTDRTFDRGGGAGARSDAGTADGGSDSSTHAAYVLDDFVKGRSPSDRSVFGLTTQFDGDDLLIAAAGESVTAGGTTVLYAGRGYVYRHTAGGYAPDAPFESPHPQMLGAISPEGIPIYLVNPPALSMARTADGSIYVVGFGGENGPGGENTGVVYVFDAAGKTPPRALEGVVPRAGDGFGFRMALDGDELAVSAPWTDASDANRTFANVGAVYLFRRSGDSFQFEKPLKPAFLRENQLYGASLALHGSTLVVGAPGDAGTGQAVGVEASMGEAAFVGAAFAYERSADGTWSEQTYIKANDASTDQCFGSDVALTDERLVVGAPGFNVPGGVYFFERGSGGWVQDGGPLTLTNRRDTSAFGLAVAYVDDVLVVGAPLDSDGADGSAGLPNSGAAYVYRHGAGGFEQLIRIKAKNATEGAFFGVDVAASHGRVAIGATCEPSLGPYGATNMLETTRGCAGAVYVYRPSAGALNDD